MSDWNKQNPERHREIDRLNKKRNKEHYKLYYHKKYNSDPNYRLRKYYVLELERF